LCFVAFFGAGACLIAVFLCFFFLDFFFAIAPHRTRVQGHAQSYVATAAV
jgi:hypothetical protein